MSRIMLIAVCVFVVACSGGEPCGGGQYADARAVLPNSGINAGDTILISFNQRDTRELTEFNIVHHWPSGLTDPEPDPRVRIVRDDGRVLIDAIGSRPYQSETRYQRLSWVVFMWIRDSSIRNALFEGFRDQTLWIELWAVGAPQPATRVRLQTDRFGTAPAMTCA